ncbi:hypothetical protein C5167_014986 [Papaver somniferum]|uniref:Uncharacterized protein n=1 Tax=Papaver somniferum TaxID=3469 RepID=A0A4Y7J935_PAPSO|nr:hypothetical protein C5167_014986 [Papaver somniferum]
MVCRKRFPQDNTPEPVQGRGGP